MHHPVLNGLTSLLRFVCCRLCIWWLYVYCIFFNVHFKEMIQCLTTIFQSCVVQPAPSTQLLLVAGEIRIAMWFLLFSPTIIVQWKMTHFEDLSLIFRLAPFSMKNPWMIWVPELPETTSKFAPENGWERKMISPFGKRLSQVLGRVTKRPLLEAPKRGSKKSPQFLPCLGQK